MQRAAARSKPPQMPWRMTSAVKADATQSAASAAGDELSAPCNGGKCRETRLTARRLPCSCEVLAPEANLKIAERGEDKADAQQGARLKAARHFPQIHKHCTRNGTVLNSTAYRTTRRFPLSSQAHNSAIKCKRNSHRCIDLASDS
jgi:hypothetical protein